MNHTHSLVQPDSHYLKPPELPEEDLQPLSETPVCKLLTDIYLCFQFIIITLFYEIQSFSLTQS